MENKIQVFTNDMFGEVRTVNDGSKILFCGSDIAKALGYAKPANAITAHCKGVTTLMTPSTGGIQQTKFITEGDVFRLIAHSKLPSAAIFESWVFDEVLPQIRKTGGYIPVKPNDDYESVLKRNNDILEQTFTMMQQLKPKVEVYDTFLASPTETSFKDYADTFGCGRNKLMNFLRDCNVLGKKNTSEGRIPFGRFVNNGYFVVRLQPCADGVFRRVTYITPKGIDYIHKLCKKYHFNTEVA